jgi:hypothetical protein
MGAPTYIGNAPNLMIYAMAVERGIAMSVRLDVEERASASAYPRRACEASAPVASSMISVVISS